MTTSQCEKILRHMKDFGFITAMDAMQEYGIMRLASRIGDLRRRGIGIISETKTGKNRYGDTVHFAVYRLAEEDKE